jgi:hypothetical protein
MKPAKDRPFIGREREASENDDKIILTNQSKEVF